MSFFNSFSQFAIPILTLGGQLAIALKYPEYGIILNLLAQPFWLFSTWRSYKKAGQVGMLINTLALTIITIFGVVNYWFFSR